MININDPKTTLNEIDAMRSSPQSQLLNDIFCLNKKLGSRAQYSTTQKGKESICATKTQRLKKQRADLDKS